MRCIGPRGAHADRDVELVGEPLQLVLPDAQPIAVAASSALFLVMRAEHAAEHVVDDAVAVEIEPSAAARSFNRSP
jgi:hypothetical protein